MKKIILFFLGGIIAIGSYIYLMVRRQNNIKSEILTNCTNDTIVNLRNGDLSLIFNNKYEEMIQNKMTMQIIRKSQVFGELNYTKKNGNVEIKLEEHKLYTTDSIKITFNNNNFIYIHGFENEAEYAYGEHFIGCFLLYYRVDNQEVQAIHDGSRISIL